MAQRPLSELPKWLLNYWAPQIKEAPVPEDLAILVVRRERLVVELAEADTAIRATCTHPKSKLLCSVYSETDTLGNHKATSYHLRCQICSRELASYRT